VVDNIFRTIITAVDNSANVVAQANQRWGKLGAGIQTTQKSIGGFSKAVGFDKIEASFRGVTGAAGDFLDKITSTAAPLAAIAGVGAVVGLAEMEKRWAGVGSEVTRTSNVIGMSKQGLQEWRAVADLAGTSVDGMTEGLNSLGNTLNDAIHNRNQGALVAMNKIGLQLHYTKDGAIDTADAFMQLNRAVNMPGRNAQTDQTIVSMLGASSLQPVLRMLPSQVEEYRRQVYALGMVQGDDAIAKADAFAQSQRNLGGVLEGVGNTMMTALAPAFQPIIDHTTNWIANNQKLIETKVGKWADEWATAIDNIDWDAVDQGINTVLADGQAFIDAIGGWKGVLIGFAAIMAIDVVSSIVGIGVAFTNLGILLMANPIAAGILAIVGVAAFAAIEIIKNWKPIKAFFSDLWDGVTSTFEAGWKHIKPIVDWFKDSWLGQLLGKAASGFSAVSQSLDDAGFVPVGSTGAFKPRPAANAPTITNAETDARSKQAMSYFEAQGKSPAAAAGIVANLMRESRLNAGAVGDNGAALGVAQWHKDRADAIGAHFGKPVGQMSFEEQLSAVDWELSNGDPQARKAGKDLDGVKNANDAGRIVSLEYERPWWKSSEALTRGGMADSLFSKSGAIAGAMASALALSPAPALAGPYAPPGAAPATGGVTTAPAGPPVPAVAAFAPMITVEFIGAPAGVVAKASGPGSENVQLKVSYRLPSDVSP
jgi:hypothetical protein